MIHSVTFNFFPSLPFHTSTATTSAPHLGLCPHPASSCHLYPPWDVPQAPQFRFFTPTGFSSHALGSSPPSLHCLPSWVVEASNLNVYQWMNG